MTFTQIYDLTWLINGLLMAPLFTCVLFHVCRGNKNKWLMTLCALFLASAVGAVFLGCCLYSIYVLDSVSEAVITNFAVGVLLYYPLFSAAHLMLAAKYRAMSKNAPAVLEGKEPRPRSAFETCAFWTLMVLNAVAGICQAVGAYLFRMQVNVQQLSQIDPWVLDLYNFGINGNNLVSFVAGLVLTVSVFRIHSFFVKQNATHFINTRQLVRHATAFGLYVVSEFALAVTLTIYIYTDSPNSYQHVEYAGMFLNIAQVVSQVLLAQIFWNLGTKLPQKATPETEQASSLIEDTVVADFDEDAEIQSEMWNMLVVSQRAGQDMRDFTLRSS